MKIVKKIIELAGMALVFNSRDYSVDIVRTATGTTVIKNPLKSRFNILPEIIRIRISQDVKENAQ
jgi:hypothetical protein